MRCDCHVHIVGAPERYPQLPERTYLAGLAPLETRMFVGWVQGGARPGLAALSVVYSADARGGADRVASGACT